MGFDPAVPFEMGNGAVIIVGAFFLYWMLRYLWKETKRRDLSLRAWFCKLPVGMHLAMAIVIFDLGVLIKATMSWAWRAIYGAGPFTQMQLIIYCVGNVVIMAGALYKIRAVTKPDLGEGPWVVAATVVAWFVFATVLRHYVL